MYYPSPERIVEYNYLCLLKFPVKRADAHKVLSHSKVSKAIEECKQNKGSLYFKAAILLRAIIQAHAFASGNRRTAFVVTKEFIIANGGEFKINDNSSQARVLTGLREGFYTDKEIEEWIKHGKIKEFKRE